MAINKNHEFEELEGVKCAVVERNVLPPRVAFLKNLLEYNRYKVVIVSSPPPKALAPVPTKEGEQPPAPLPPAPETFTVGVTDVTFNATNAIFGRLLHAKNQQIVTLAYWKQQETVNDDEVSYFDK